MLFDPIMNKTSLIERKEIVHTKEFIELNEELLREVDEERSKAMEGITKFHLKYFNEGTIDEKGTSNTFQ